MADTYPKRTRSALTLADTSGLSWVAMQKLATRELIRLKGTV